VSYVGFAREAPASITPRPDAALIYQHATSDRAAISAPRHDIGIACRVMDDSRADTAFGISGPDLQRNRRRLQQEW
jgi:hypothetical protein